MKVKNVKVKRKEDELNSWSSRIRSMFCFTYFTMSPSGWEKMWTFLGPSTRCDKSYAIVILTYENDC